MPKKSSISRKTNNQNIYLLVIHQKSTSQEGYSVTLKAFGCSIQHC